MVIPVSMAMRMRVLSVAAICMLLLTCLPAHAEPDAEDGLFLRFLNAPSVGQPLAKPPRLSVSFGGQRFAAVMDTGSTGVVVAADMIPHWQSLRRLGPARLTYTSSGRVMTGWWVETPVEVAGRGRAQVRTEPMPVMAVTRISCLRQSRRCRDEMQPKHVAMLGIGFARQGDRQRQGTPDHNPFLRLEHEAGSGARRGYIITREGVAPGLRGDIDPAFRTVPLMRSSTFDDWAAAPACIIIASRTPPACGTVLVDTGVAGAFLTVPPALLQGETENVQDSEMLRPGTQVTVRLGREPEPVATLSYTFRTGDPADPLAPRDVALVRSGKALVFLNTSLHLLNGFDYLYDAERGLVGFRPRS